MCCSQTACNERDSVLMGVHRLPYSGRLAPLTGRYRQRESYMKLFDIIKKTGSSIIRDVVPGGGILIDAVNTLLPKDRRLPTNASGRDIENAVQDLPPEQRAALLERQFDVDEALIKARSETIVAEASNEQFLPSNWRPITMLAFVGMIGGYWFGLTPEIPSEAVADMFELVKLGLGGYVIGRSAEKITKEVSGKGLLDRLKK